jgi:hypothetical protein
MTLNECKRLITSINGVVVTFWTRISFMEGEYSQEWVELRRLRQRALTIALAGVGVFVLVPVVTTFVSQSAAKVIGLGLFAAWVALLFRFFFVSGEYVYWSCPRCGKPFHYVARWYGRWNNPFARRGVHCGLPKWTDTDPDPKLKHELDPFRSDSILKLGE